MLLNMNIKQISSFSSCLLKDWTNPLKNGIKK